MNQDIILKLKDEIKKELIIYYDTLKSKVDIKAQSIVLNGSFNQDYIKQIFEENVYLVNQMDRICDSNLSDIEQYFQNIKIEIEKISSCVNEDELFKMKEEIKNMALKSYLIWINDPRFGLHFEFNWYIDTSQLNFIK